MEGDGVVLRGNFRSGVTCDRRSFQVKSASQTTLVLWFSFDCFHKQGKIIPNVALSLSLSAHQRPSICTVFRRPDAPLLIETAAFRHLKCAATRTISSSFALPSTGGDFSSACQRPPSLNCSSELIREFGLTFTWIVFVLCMAAPSLTAEIRRAPHAYARLRVKQLGPGSASNQGAEAVSRSR